MMRNYYLSSLLKPCAYLIVVTLTVFFTLHSLEPPPAVLADAIPSEFSVERALTHLRAIALHPHPVGSAEHTRVREYLVAQLEELGISPHVQEAHVTRGRFGIRPAVTINNIMARIPGTKPTKAVGLFAHYDSVAGSRGASDDGSGVVTLLETARALLASAPLTNDVILVFTDAEEVGSLGARAFVENHPWASEIGIFLNFEARGNYGPSVMFRSSRNNGFLIGELAKAAPHPITSSLIAVLSGYLPNYTDFSELTERGIPGFDFAYAGGLDVYHTYDDSVENTDLRSIQHHGSYAVSLTRHFGEMNLNQSLEKPDMVYFDILQTLVYYPKIFGTILGVVVVLLFGLLFWKSKFILKAAAINAVAIIIVTSSAYGIHMLILSLTNFRFLIQNATALLATYLLLSLGLFHAVYMLLTRKNSDEIAAGTLFPMVVACAVLGFMVPEASYIIQWPVLFVLLGNVVQRWRPSTAAVVKLVAILPAAVMLTELCYVIFSMEAGMLPEATVFSFAVTLSFFVDAFATVSRLWMKRIVAASLVSGVALLISVIVSA